MGRAMVPCGCLAVVVVGGVGVVVVVSGGVGASGLAARPSSCEDRLRSFVNVFVLV